MVPICVISCPVSPHSKLGSPANPKRLSIGTMPNSTIPPISAHTLVLRSGVDQIKHTTVLWLTVCVGIMASSRFLSFSDPFPYQAAIRATDAELYPTAKGQFHAELTQVTMDRLWMQRFNERLPEVYASRVRPGRRVIGFLTDPDGYQVEVTTYHGPGSTPPH